VVRARTLSKSQPAELARTEVRAAFVRTVTALFRDKRHRRHRRTLVSYSQHGVRTPAQGMRHPPVQKPADGQRRHHGEPPRERLALDQMVQEDHVQDGAEDDRHAQREMPATPLVVVSPTRPHRKADEHTHAVGGRVGRHTRRVS
jgi:hypothetical protein